MRLLAHRLETERSASLAALAGQLGLVAGLTTLGCALGVAGDSLAGPGSSLGHAFASGSVHAGFLSAGWILALHGRGGWQGPALRGAGALLVASLAAGSVVTRTSSSSISKSILSPGRCWGAYMMATSTRPPAT